MNRTSSVAFQNNTRIHIGLHASELDRATAFYTLLLGCNPVKVKSDYAKFEAEDPSVNLSLTAGGNGAPNGGVHYGIQVKSTDAVIAAKQRFEAAGITFQSEDQTVCCYALQDKFWIADPDGNRWEIFVVLEDTDAFREEEPSACCKEESESVS
ncbi:MAG: glyoxalase/bleomycin resistance/dioxygenase family protein [Candidatus Latescibacteria bacterium]|nr:glyoxalase/bleomycin resistance/dioxygenase family protein [Candidatus Latescibacterota bacterium]